MRLEGLGAQSNLTFVPATVPTAAQTACGQVGGIWQASPAGCTMDVGSSGPPSWCDLPFMTTLFPNDCSPLTAAQLAAYGNYTAYQTAQLPQGTYTPPGQSGPAPTGTDASGALVTANTAQSNALVSDCDYQSGLNYPNLSAMVGPSLTTMLTNPFANNPTCTNGGLPGWLLYAGVATMVVLMLKKK